MHYLFCMLLCHYITGSRGLMLESWTHNRKVVGSSLFPAGIAFEANFYSSDM